MRRFWIALLLVLGLSATCLGDSAPLAPVGPHVQPLDSTTVRLAEERIEIFLRRDTRHDARLSTSAVGEYRIWFRFEPEADEEMMVGFPLFIFDPEQAIFGAHIENLRVEIDGREVATEVRESAVHQDADAGPVNWAVFPVTFRAGQPLEMVVSYTMNVLPYGKGYGAPLWVAYVLRTGAHWAGTIGRAEAVLAMDRPIRAEDIRSEENPFRITTPGWVLEDGALRWVWEDVEPDFDIHVVLENPYWRDMGVEIREMLQAGIADPAALTAVIEATRSLAEAGNMGMNSSLRDGSLPGEAADRLLPDVLAAAESFLAEHPDDDEVRVQYLLLLRETSLPLVWESADWVWRVRSEDHLALFLREAVAHGMTDRLYVQRWRPWAEEELAGYPWRPETQDAIAAFLTEVMPGTFASEGAARAWVEANAGEALTPERADRLAAEAVRRAATAGSGAAQPPAADPADRPSPPAGETPAPGAAEPTDAGARRGWAPAVGVAVGAVLLLALGTVVVRRRRRSDGEARKG